MQMKKLNKIKNALVMGLVIGLMSFPMSVQSAELACGKRAEVLKKMKTVYNEVPISMGIAANGTLIEVFATPDRSKWTLTVTSPKDWSTCYLAEGQYWERLDEQR